MKRFTILMSLFLLTLPLHVFAEQSTENEEKEINVNAATFDVSEGFEKEVQLKQYTQLEWTLDNGAGSAMVKMSLPGKQLPASGWKDFYENKGWDTAQPNEMNIEFSDGTVGTLYVDVIGNSGKVRFWMEAVTGKEEGQSVSKDTEKSSEKQKKVTWYIWLNDSEDPIITQDMESEIEKIAPGQYHMKVEQRDEEGKVMDEYEKTFSVSTNKGGILPETATPWPNIIFAGSMLFLLGLLGRILIHGMNRKWAK